MAAKDASGVHHEQGRAVLRRVGVHRVQKGDVIDARGQVGEQVADPLAALAVFAEVPLGTDNPALVAAASAAEGLDGNGFAVQRIERGFVVKGIEVAGAAIHEQEDHALGLGSKVRIPRSQRIDVGLRSGGTDPIEEAIRREQAGKRQAGKPGTGFPEKLAPRPAAELSGFVGMAHGTGPLIQVDKLVGVQRQ